VLTSVAIQPLEEEISYSPKSAAQAIRADVLHRDTVKSMLESAMDGIRNAEAAGDAREEIRRQFAHCRSLMSQSPILRRTQVWPRGYQGDFETIEAIVSGDLSHTSAAVDELERFIFASPVVQQHRNKIAVQSAYASAAMMKREQSGDVRILSTACGGSADLAQALSARPQFKGEIVINDQDQDALELSIKRLVSVSSEASIIPWSGNVLQLLRRPASIGPCDLVIAGGLCDYLDERPLVFLLRQVWHSLLKPGGAFFWTNIAFGNPYRFWMEYLVDWFLIERTRGAILNSCAQAGIPRSSINLELDQTGLTWLVEITKPAR
jgi:extracellular factor (EF) 3-hydroxypalmitic acid methyl ester biosynthesis protein